MSAVLVVNSGSSSFKYQLIDMATEQMLATGLVERIGEGTGHAVHTIPWDAVPSVDRSDAPLTTARDLPIPDHTAGFRVMLDAFAANGPSLERHPLIAVGHRVVHGGKRFFGPTLVNDLVKINIEELSELAPLHNPANLQGIEAAQNAFPDVPHVAVFDTAFHSTLAPDAYSYAIDSALAAKHRLRKYGFHGTSHKFVSEEAAAFLGRPLADLNQIVLHLGNGASASAIAGGRSVETSMGLTPLEGLVMGTRSGDIDPAVLIHLHRRTGMSFDDIDELLNRKSGLLGLAGAGDMRDVLKRAATGDERASIAFDVYVHRLKGYVGNYMAQLGRVDVIAFTAGVGENAAAVRAGALAGLEGFGIRLSAERNEESSRDPRRISADDSDVEVLVIPTNEELEIARQTMSVL
ncbi:acetate kinase [Mycetocola manganoxydans]|uniref:Acetate kinase n=1 Tax=Mycetocola manganoxydans TaxID=699879 RepID=A0A3L7A267_9MICO|nr:acetate kinase [Mycetocola manganoxydans]RLP73472.1 acetate kinase [Mycetocola manganoxydans]GHD41562.1 acetate kinase [Mycetocola manganoxydans]